MTLLLYVKSSSVPIPKLDFDNHCLEADEPCLNMCRLKTVTLISFTFVINCIGDNACYYPSGNKQTVDRPCDNSVSESHCCGVNDICLTNGMCFQLGDVLLVTRGSCTDQSWSSSACPRECSDSKSVQLSVFNFEAKGFKVIKPQELTNWGNFSSLSYLFYDC